MLLEVKQLLEGQGLLEVYEQGTSLQRVKKLAMLNNSQTFFFIYPLSPAGLVDKKGFGPWQVIGGPSPEMGRIPGPSECGDEEN